MVFVVGSKLKFPQESDSTDRFLKKSAQSGQNPRCPPKYTEMIIHPQI